MPRERSIQLVKPRPASNDDEGMVFYGPDDTIAHAPPELVPMGTLAEVVRELAAFNTGPDGSAESNGLLYGPGLAVQLPLSAPEAPVTQLDISITEEDTAWPVLIRMCRRLGWKMMDPATGRTFG